MAAYAPGGIFSVNGLISTSMSLRDDRLKEAKTHANKTQRDLQRDRQSLERKEKQLLSLCKQYVTKGDIRSAKLVAGQISTYRKIHGRNLESSIMIDTKAQAMVSEHKINKAAVETMKGFAYANFYESFGRVEAREQRMAWRAEAVNSLEDRMRSCTTEAYKDEKEAECSSLPTDDVQSILIQAYGKPVHFPNNSEEDNAYDTMVINLKTLDHRACEVTLFRSDKTIDSIKRRIVGDKYAVSQLGLSAKGELKYFELGWLLRGVFQKFESQEKLIDIDIRDGDSIWIKICEENHSSDLNDVELMQRLANVRM